MGFEAALRAWRPLLSAGGGIVVSECVWLGADRDDAAAYFWGGRYPEMGSTADALAQAERAGLRLVASERLPASAWLSSFVAPLASRISTLEKAADTDRELAVAVDGLKREIDSFPDWADAVGCVYFAFDAEGRPDTDGRAAITPRARSEGPRGQRPDPGNLTQPPRN
jgi:hypothetical protein